LLQILLKLLKELSVKHTQLLLEKMQFTVLIAMKMQLSKVLSILLEESSSKYLVGKGKIKIRFKIERFFNKSDLQINNLKSLSQNDIFSTSRLNSSLIIATILDFR
jgi:hypothetical protein